jgi:hypothetical protein
LSFYTDKTENLFEAAKILLTNEWSRSKGKLNLRLIGVRVSSLKSSLENLENYPKNNSMRRLDSFFTKIDKPLYNDQECENFDDFGVVYLVKCPKCEIYFECNTDFYIQHLDSCL